MRPADPRDGRGPAVMPDAEGAQSAGAPEPPAGWDAQSSQDARREAPPSSSANGAGAGASDERPAPNPPREPRTSSRIEALRRRFVRLTMIAVAVVLCVVGLAMNAANYLATTSDLDDMLALISQTQAAGVNGYPGAQTREDGAWDEPDEWDEDDWEDYWEDGDLDPRGFWSRPITQETAYATRWFSVRWASGGSIAEVNLAHIASVSRADLPRYVQAATRAGSGFGWEGDFRYLVIEGSGTNEAIFLDASSELHALRTLALLTLGVLALSVAAIFCLVWVLSRWAVRPVAEADARQRRFVTDASHELKTPLAVIRTSLGVLEMDVGENRWIDKAQGQAERMGELVDELVVLSRLDEEGASAEGTFDASEQVGEVAAPFMDYAEGQGHELRLLVAPDLTYAGNAAGLRQLVSVLLDNAVKYALPGGAITLTLERHKRKGLRLTCENPAALMDADTLAHLFDRFWRPDDSRNRASGGFGIGLSIAREVAESAGGTITATQSPSGDLLFTVLLP